MTVDVQAIWESMAEEDPPASGGYLTRRIPMAGYDVHLTQERPSGLSGFRAAAGEASGASWRNLRSSRGLDVVVDARPGTPSSLKLSERGDGFHDVFTALVVDLLQSLTALSKIPPGDRPLMLDVLADRVMRWQRCLSTVEDGLGDELQAGLFGELLVLERMLAAGVPPLAVCEGWTGPDRLSQDFQLEGCSVEVKTTRTLQPGSMRISSERQLDGSSTARLILVHVSLDERVDGTGQTLAGQVAAVRSAVAASGLARLALDDRLLAYGYLDLHADRYSKRSYGVRAIGLYDVRSGFPRIVEADVPTGVGSVAYDLSIAACEPFRINNHSFEQAIPKDQR